RPSRQASSTATNALSSTAGSSPPAASPAVSTPPPARRAGLSASAGLSAGSPEQVPADRELQFLCPRTGCNTDLFLKENIRKDRADYPACSNFSAGTCAWTGLMIKYPGKVCGSTPPRSRSAKWCGHTPSLTWNARRVTLTGA
ncbi:unnamed protein product, partial [Ectocarpus sp. 4 AP-2014]